MSETFTMELDGVTLIGEIPVRNIYRMKVGIVHPFTDWEDELEIMGIGKQSPKDFSTEYGDERAQNASRNYL